MKFNKKEYLKKYQQEHKEYLKAYHQKWCEKNKETNKIKKHEYYINNKKRYNKNSKELYKKNKDKPEFKEKRRVYMKGYCEKNKEKRKAYGKKYYDEHKKERKAYANEHKKRRKKEDIDFKLKVNLSSRLLTAFKKYTKTGKIMSSKEYGINYKDIIEHLKPFPKDIENYDIDHVIPLSKFELTNKEQVKRAFAPNNHKWLTKEANRSKGNKLVHPDYYKKYGRTK